MNGKRTILWLTPFWSDGLGESFIWAANGLIAYTNRDGKATLFTRDGAGRLLGVTNANREVIALAYAALNQVTDLWDGRTNHTVWSYDNYGRVATKVDARGSSVATYSYARTANSPTAGHPRPATPPTGMTESAISGPSPTRNPASATSMTPSIG
ncbi:MAG: RHS repeat domain-containing protein [Verrucomicrobiota bacterium]|jgi:YD repeat-containing protein